MKTSTTMMRPSSDLDIWFYTFMTFIYVVLGVQYATCVLTFYFVYNYHGCELFFILVYVNL